MAPIRAPRRTTGQGSRSSGSTVNRYMNSSQPAPIEKTIGTIRSTGLSQPIWSRPISLTRSSARAVEIEARANVTAISTIRPSRVIRLTTVFLTRLPWSSCISKSGRHWARIAFFRLPIQPAPE